MLNLEEKEELLQILEIVTKNEREKEIYTLHLSGKDIKEISELMSITNTRVNQVIYEINLRINRVKRVKKGNSLYYLNLDISIINLLTRYNMYSIEDLLNKIHHSKYGLEKIRGLGQTKFNKIKIALSEYLKENKVELEKIENCKFVKHDNKINIKMKYYCPVCETKIAFFMDSEGVKHTNILYNTCPLCGEKSLIHNDENDEISLEEFR